jgi:uncharacterized spore protein YtfJ
MNIDEMKHTLRREFDWIAAKQEELRLQAHLAKAETRAELQRLENTWQRVREELHLVGDHEKGSVEQIGSLAATLLDELKRGYERVRVELAPAGDHASAIETRSPQLTPFAEAIDHLAGQLGNQAQNVFAAPVTRGAVTVVPVARIAGGFGAGNGPPNAPAPYGGGTGGGGGFVSLPLGFIEIDQDGARFHRFDNAAEAWVAAGEGAWRLLQRGLSGVRARRAKSSTVNPQ